MKKLLLLSTLLFFLANEANAQLRPAFGIRGGVNFSTLSDTKQEVDSRRIGLLIGAYAVIPISGTPVSIQPEVLYTQKGAEVNTVEINLSYIQIPVFLRVDVATESLISPHLLLGPYVAFNLTAEENPPPQPGLPLLDERINKTVFGVAIGGGIDIKSINIGIRYSQGLTQVFETEEGHNKVISILAGYQF